MKKKLSLMLETIILVLILSDIILLTSIFFIDVSPDIYQLIVYFDLFVVLILIPEFIYRLWKSEDKRKFLLHNWTDIIGMIPEILVGPVSTFFRYFRLVRLVRILALFKKQIRHLFEILHKTNIDYGILILIIVLFSCSTLFFFFELGINENINTFDDAFWYLMVTITTVGYGDIYPASDAGRIIAVIIMFTGIGFVSFLTAIVTSKLVKTTKTDDKLDEAHKKLDQLQSELNELKEIIKSKK